MTTTTRKRPTKKEIERLYYSGKYTYKEMEDILGTTCIGHYIDKYNIKKHGRLEYIQKRCNKRSSQRVRAKFGFRKPTKKELVKLYSNSTLIVNDIIKKLHTTKSTFHACLKEYNIPLRGYTIRCRDYGLPAITKKELEPLYNDPMLSVTDIAKYFRLSRATVCGYAKRYGLEKNTAWYPKVSKKEILRISSKPAISLNKICEELGMSAGIFYTHIRYYNIDRKHKPPIIKCAVCGAEFEYSRKNCYKKKYCSNKCRHIGHTLPKQEFIDKCETCGIEIKYVRARRYKKVCYCDKCKLAARYKKQKKGTINGSVRRLIKINCDWCGEVFYRPKSNKYKRKFCSMKCYQAWRMENLRGKTFEEFWGPEKTLEIKQKMWKNGKGPTNTSRQYTEVHSYKYHQFRHSIFTRDDFTCRDCGNRGGYLEGHHLFKWTDYPTYRYVMWNVISLCKKCHNKTKFKEEVYCYNYFYNWINKNIMPFVLER